MKKFILLAFLALVSWFAFADVDHFVLTVSSNPAKLNEAVDLTIKAVDWNWGIVKDYQWDVFMDLKWWSDNDYILPNDWIYTFSVEDQWEKKFSKGLVFKKDWEFKLTVYDVADENIQSELTIKVWWSSSSEKTASITIDTPIAWSTEKWKNVSVSWKTNFPNSPLQVMLDNKKATEWMTDANWDYSLFIESITSAEHSLKVVILDSSDKTLWESDQIKFKYEQGSGDDEKLFKWLVIQPSKTVDQWAKVTVIVDVADSVSSADLTVWTWVALPMEKKWKQYTKNLTMDKWWSFKLSLKLLADGNAKDYKDVDTITVKEVKRVNEVKYFANESSKTWLNLERTFSWDVKMFSVAYGLSKTAMTWVVLTGSSKIVLSKLSLSSTYYVQITPMSADGKTQDWMPSDIIEIKPTHNAASCKIVWIKLSTIKEWDKNYLVWTKAEGATKYIIYKSEWESNSLKTMQKVWETTGTRFEFPFDSTSKKDLYAYYAVEAVCEDWNNMQIDKVKKVKVGPYDTMIVMLLLSALLYWGYKMYWYSK